MTVPKSPKAKSPRIFRIILPVSNIEAAAKFYTHLLAVQGQRVSPGRHYFNCGGVILACFDPHADGDDFDAHPNPGHIYLSVDDLEPFHRRAKEAGCRDLGPIAKRPWGERSFYCKDPFGNPLCFVDEDTVFTG
jgi:catechol 2,3-dioxygenase-like lactoylglutathione lyase family enzyme